MNRKQADPSRSLVDRRAFLGGAAVGALPLVSTVLASSAQAQGKPPKGGAAKLKDRPFPGVIARQKNPDNVEFPFATLDSFLTPNEQFYVRTHFETPKIDAKTWRLKVEGAVKKPLEIDYDELCKMPSHTVTSLLECSGNSRIFLKPPQMGIRWELGGVSNAEWTGVRLADILQRAGVEDSAVEVILQGADKGEFKSSTPGVIPYARSLPIKKARRPEVLLAYKMNGKDLPMAHGAPVRALVAGWYGMASVKWLSRIVAVEQPFHGYFQTFMYAIWDRRHGVPELTPVGPIQVKSEIARPTFNEVIAAKSRYRVFGAAWAGESEVVHVEISTDGGESWDKAKLLDKQAPYTWRFWEYNWRVPAETGPRILMARATDAMGHIQPLKRDDDRRDAVISHVLPIAVEVR